MVKNYSETNGNSFICVGFKFINKNKFNLVFILTVIMV